MRYSLLKYLTHILLIAFLILSFSFRLSLKKDKIQTIDDDYANDLYLRYDDFTYNDSIKTVLLYNSKSQLDYPILSLNGNERLILSFDDLSNNLSEYNYSIIHCNTDWTPSDLLPSEYLTGYFEGNIINYNPSFNSDLPYTNYSVEIPNENMGFNKSGNYILLVYTDNKEKPVLTKRFMVYENNISINATVKRATNVNEQFHRQEIDFEIIHENYQIRDPFRNVNVVIMQNYRWDNAITGLKPRFVKDALLDYNYNGENVFDGNNEFREFDIKSLNYQTIRIKNIKYSNIDKLTHVHILPDENRSFKKYFTTPDINGNFLIKRNEGNQSEIEADYVKVHFSLPYILPFTDGNVYLFGKFSDWKFKEDLKLEYDTTNSTYHKEVLLKQGYYNYQYCFVKDGSKNTGDISVIEGSHAETENDYVILVYHRPTHLNYDKLIGQLVINSSN